MDKLQMPGARKAFEPGRLLLRQLRRQGFSTEQPPRDAQSWERFLRAVDRVYEETRLQNELFGRADMLASVEMRELYLAHEARRAELDSATRGFQMLHDALEVAGFGAFTFKPDTRMCHLTSKLAQVFGLGNAACDVHLSVLRPCIREEDRQSLLDALMSASKTRTSAECDFRLSDKTNEGWLTCRISGHSQNAHDDRQVLGVVVDTTRRRQAEQRALNLATVDQLTHLFNRQHFTEVCMALMDSSGGASRPFALLFIDLDGFKEVNDTLGHTAGDRLLTVIGERLVACVPDTQHLCRFGGDEFLVLVEGLSSDEALETLTSGILETITQPVQIDSEDVVVSGSVGITRFPAQGQSFDRLLQNADTAMYQAKAAGRNTWRFFSDDMNAASNAHYEMVRRLRQAIAEDRLTVAYQALVNGVDAGVVGAEALVRWFEPDLGNIPPFKIIPLAEKSGLINALGDLVLRHALVALGKWDECGGKRIGISVNFSAMQFNDPHFVENLTAALGRHNVEPSRLCVEITESVMMADTAACAKRLEQLRALGVRVAIDDFGTGYSSLVYLKKLPIDVIKIDRSFVSEITSADDKVPLVHAVISIARSLDLDVLAEGIETDQQRQALLRLGCVAMQGYYFHRPVPAAQFEKMLADHKPVATT